MKEKAMTDLPPTEPSSTYLLSTPKALLERGSNTKNVLKAIKAILSKYAKKFNMNTASLLRQMSKSL